MRVDTLLLHDAAPAAMMPRSSARRLAHVACHVDIAGHVAAAEAKKPDDIDYDAVLDKYAACE